MLSQQIRRSFLNYFKSKGHALVASSPVIPHDDPTLLFINAGMNQFKDVFLGKAKRDYTRAATTQKCIRVGGKHNDLDNVGHTSRHLTFFEMLGNFSFGDYFKKEAIDFAWEVSTKVFGFDPEKIWVSVFQDDDEAFALWERHMPAKRLVRFGEKENFWAMGETGPCGPCSELLYDRGEGYGGAKSPKEDVTGERYLEFWNLVFMQYEKDVSGKLNPLPKQSIDTGSGLERVVSLKMGVDSVFQTDILRHLISAVERVSGKRYDPKEEKVAPAFHVIADHLRSLSFAIGDGVQPSNTDRGYVLRKILRRAVRYGRMLGLKEPFLATLYPSLAEVMGDDFPELKGAKGRIEEILTLEEEAFLRTLQRGGQLLGQVIERSRAGGEMIQGEDAFKLKDTYGFPVEEILLIAKDENLSVDVKRFEALEEEAKEKSRKAQKTAAQSFDANFFEEFVKKNPPSRFEGYGKTEGEGKIVALVVGGAFVPEIGEGEEGLVLLDQTPFYAEMGGQVGDQGLLVRGGSYFQVMGCASPYAGLIAHRGKMESGKLALGQTVSASVDRERRHFIQNHHTVTHLLHWALEKVLGSHIKQAGSLVEKERLRFDFSHHKPLSKEEIRQIEELVNEKIRSDRGVETYELSYEEAQKRGDIKQFFGEKYGAKVRVVDLDFSKELCGGTHTTRLGTIGLFKVLKEGSIAAGVRRIEAASGPFAEAYVYQEEELLLNLSQLLKTQMSGLPEKVAALLEENRTLAQQLKGARKEELKRLALEWAGKKEALNSSSHLVTAELSLSSEEMALLAEELLEKIGSGVVVLGSRGADKCHLLIAMSPDLISPEVDATKLIKEAAPLIQGGGGGKPHLAQAGGKNPSGFPAAFETVRARLRR